MKKYFERLYKNSAEEFAMELKERLVNEEKSFIITANPEIFTHAQKNADIDAMLMDGNVTLVADGISVVKAAAILGMDVKERITGVDLTRVLFQQANELSKSVFLFGSGQDTIDHMLAVLDRDYPKLKIAGAVNGYVQDKPAVFTQIKAAQPDIVLVALGVPAQEKLIYEHLSMFEKGIFMGIGGSLDVLSGLKARAPEFFIKNNLEWLYRIAKEPKRLRRFYDNNIKFMFRIMKLK